MSRLRGILAVARPRPVYSPPSMTTSPRESTVSHLAGDLACPRTRSSRRSCGASPRRGSARRAGRRSTTSASAPGRDRALARVEAEHPGRGRAGDLDPAAAGDVPVDDAPGAAGPSGARRPAARWGSWRSRRGPAPSGRLKQNGQWSVETTWRSSVRSPRHSAAWCSRGPQRRGADVLGALEVRLGEVVGGQEQVLRAGLAEDRCSPSSRAVGELGERPPPPRRARRRAGASGHLRELDRAVRGLGLQQRLADLAVVARVGLPAGERLLDEHVDGDAVLGVHHDQPAVLGGALHGAQDLAVVAVEDARVGHEQLEAGDALADEAPPSP